MKRSSTFTPLLHLIVIFLFVISACTQSRNIYLVTVETSKPKRLEPYRYIESGKIDSIVIQNFGHAIMGFKSDSIFQYSPYFRIETLNKAVYGEDKSNR